MYSIAGGWYFVATFRVLQQALPPPPKKRTAGWALTGRGAAGRGGAEVMYIRRLAGAYPDSENEDPPEWTRSAASGAPEVFPADGSADQRRCGDRGRSRLPDRTPQAWRDPPASAKLWH